VSELPVPGWGHSCGHLRMRVPGRPDYQATGVERALIAERISRYGWSFDERRRDLLSDCFTDDAVWQGSICGGEPLGPFVGREAIVQWMSEFWLTQRDQRRHMIVNTVIEDQTETEALAQAYQLLTAARSGQVALETTGFYRFNLRRADGIWRIAHLFSGYDAPFVPGKLDYLDHVGASTQDTPRDR
jgi:SnoaL-like domain